MQNNEVGVCDVDNQWVSGGARRVKWGVKCCLKVHIYERWDDAERWLYQTVQTVSTGNDVCIQEVQ